MAGRRSRAERRWPPAVPFAGEPPKVEPGDKVEIRTALGEWVPAIACSGPRFDFEQALGRQTYLTVAVDNATITERYERAVNWPAEDVRPLEHRALAANDGLFCVCEAPWIAEDGHCMTQPPADAKEAGDACG